MLRLCARDPHAQINDFDFLRESEYRRDAFRETLEHAFRQPLEHFHDSVHLWQRQSGTDAGDAYRRRTLLPGPRLDHDPEPLAAVERERWERSGPEP